MYTVVQMWSDKTHVKFMADNATQCEGHQTESTRNGWDKILGRVKYSCADEHLTAPQKHTNTYT